MPRGRVSQSPTTSLELRRHHLAATRWKRPQVSSREAGPVPEVTARVYTSDVDDNLRWVGFPFRDGDIVISTRSKSGTTWMQMICALLVFQAPVLPAPLAELSPWLDHTVEPLPIVLERLEAQQHRRFVKTHTPLDGLVPLDPRATYVVVGRHPLDMAVSLYHQGSNMDRARVAELTRSSQPQEVARPGLHDWLVGWVEEQVTPQENLDSLPGVLHHAVDAWARAGDRVLLVHYDDLLADLPGTMQWLAERLGIAVPADRWQELVAAARFDAMRRRAAFLAPDRLGVLKDPDRFFRAGTSGAGQAILTLDEFSRYQQRVSSLAPPDVAHWLHHGTVRATS
jgi:aryl sulfotransferase